MDRQIKEAAVNAAASESHPRRRAPMAVRAIVALLAACALAGAAWASLAAVTVRAYDAATASLTANLTAAAADDADLDRLAAAQRQTDAQFADAGRFTAVMPASIAAPVAANAETSRRLSALIDDAIARRAPSGSSAQTDGQQGDGTQDAQGQSSGLTDEQRGKVDELLRSNQQLATPTPSSGSTSTSTPSAPSEQPTVKPW